MNTTDFPEISGYRIIKRIGRGGMASVYLAIQEKFERNVALKIMSPHLLADDSFSQRFLREAHTVAKLSHQHIIPVFDVGRCGDFHYIAMEYLPKGDLKSRMQQGLELSQGLQIIKQLASGLHYAARKECVHRDIKPDNILFREDFSPVICDFGIARNNETTQMTVIGTVLGTPHYMSPEQALSKPVDGRSDLYSLGVILFEMLTGKVPYSGDSAVSIGISHSTKEIPRLPEEKALFQPFIDRALAKSPDHRFQDGREFVQALESVEYTWMTQHSGDDDATVLMASKRYHTSAPVFNMDPPDDVTVPKSKENQQYFATGSSQPQTDLAYTSEVIPNNPSQPTSEQQALTGAHQPPAATKPAQQTLNRILATLRDLGTIKLAGIAASLLIATFAISWLAGDDTEQTPQNITAIENLDDKVAVLNQKASQALELGNFYRPENDSAHYYLTTLLALAPDNRQGNDNIARLFSAYLNKSQQSIATGFFEDGNSWLSQATQITYYINDKALLKKHKSLQSDLLGWKKQQLLSAEKQQQINNLLGRADTLLKENKLTTPASANAFDTYREVLSIEGKNPAALLGIENIANRFLNRAEQFASDGEFTRARAFIAAASQVSPDLPNLKTIEAQINAKYNNHGQATQSAQSELLNQSLANANIRQASLEKAKAIDAIMLDAKKYITAGQLTTPVAANAVTSYRQVLSMNPTHQAALAGIDNVIELLLQSTDNAITNNQLQQAALSLTEVKTLDLDGLYYPATEGRLLNALKDQEAQLAEEAARQKQLLTLMEIAQQQITQNKIYATDIDIKSGGKPDDAFATLRQVLTIDNQHKDASALQTQLFKKIELETKTAIATKDFASADSLLNVLNTHQGNAKTITSLQKRLQRARTNLQNGLKADQIISSISTTDAKRVTVKNHTKLATAYARAAKLDPDNALAQRGLKNTNNFISDQFNRAIKEYDFERANQYAATYKKSNGNTKRSKSFYAAIAKAKETRKKVIALLNEADKIIDSPFKKPGLFGSNKSNLKQLRSARDKVEIAQQLDPRNPILKITLGHLEKKYASIIQLYLDKEKLKEARKFLNDAKLIKSSHDYLKVFENQLSS